MGQGIAPEGRQHQLGNVVVGAAGERGTAVDGLAAQGDLNVVLLVSGAAMAAASRAAVVGR